MNTRHGNEHQKQEDVLALYVLDLLDEREKSDLHDHLRSGCVECEELLDHFRQTAVILGCGAPAAEPSAGLRDRVSAISRRSPQGSTGQVQIWKDWNADQSAAMHIVRADEGAWEPVGDGVTAKRLYVDPQGGTVTMMVRMSPGASYRPHRHGGPEQCFVLEGDLKEGDIVVYAGDYQCLSTGSIHGAQTTESGCLLLIVSSLHDELLD